MTSGADDELRAAVVRRLVATYVSDSRRNVEIGELVSELEAPIAEIVPVCLELIEAGHAYPVGDPLRAVRLSDNGFAYANDALRLDMLEDHDEP